MITTFYFDHEMLKDNDMSLEIVNSTILDKWLKYGCLAIHQDEFILIREQINEGKIPKTLVQKWNIALTSFMKKTIDIEPRNVYSLCTSQDKCYKDTFNKYGIMTAIVDEVYLEIFDEKQTEIEIIKPIDIHKSNNFTLSEKHASTDIKKDDNINEIWNNIFKNLSLNTSKITIIDRYLMKNVMDDYAQNKKTSIDTLAELLSKNNKKINVVIYSACDINGEITNAERVKDYLNNSLRNKPYVKERIQFEVNYCANRFFSNEAHDRMIVFDKHAVQIGNGVDIFRVGGINNCHLNVKNIHSTNFDETYKTLSKNRSRGLASL